MNQRQVYKALEVARKIRLKQGYGNRGYVTVFEGRWCGWCESMPDPAHFMPGCFMMSHAELFIAEGGNQQNGAKEWKACLIQSKA